MSDTLPSMPDTECDALLAKLEQARQEFGQLLDALRLKVELDTAKAQLEFVRGQLAQRTAELEEEKEAHRHTVRQLTKRDDEIAKLVREKTPVG